MKIIEGECEQCKGNMIIDAEELECRCEDCGWTFKFKNKGQLKYIIANKPPRDWGPKERRQVLTRAGKQLVNAFKKDEPPTSDEVWDTIQAYRGMIDDEETLGNLRKGGFIL